MVRDEVMIRRKLGKDELVMLKILKRNPPMARIEDMGRAQEVEDA